jgi:glycosyltransferase involved in cell wall biosynthesis
MFGDRNRLIDGLKWRIERFFQIPDDCAAWRSTAVHRALALYEEEGFDVIYATGWPWTSFLIAAEVSRRTGCPFVVDYRDLWKPSDAEWDKHTKLQKWLQPHLEKKVLRKASAVITTTPSFAKMLEEDGAGDKAVCITNGFDPDDFLTATVLGEHKEDGYISISYTGVWRPGYGPDDLYRAIRHLKDFNSSCLARLKVTVAGFPSGRARAYGIEDIVEELGQVPHAQAIDLMTNANALYLPVSKGIYEKASLPGKLFEYLGSGRPIIASSLPDSEVTTVLLSVGGNYVVSPGDVNGLAEAIEKLCAVDGATPFSERIPGAVARYERSSLTKDMAALLDRVSRKT